MISFDSLARIFFPNEQTNQMCEKEKEIKKRVGKALGTKVNSPKGKNKVAITFLLEISGGNGLLTISCKGCWDVMSTSGFECILTVCRLGVRSSGGKNPSCTRELKKKRHPPFTPSIHSPQNQLCTYIKAPVVRSGKASRRIQRVCGISVQTLLLAPEKVPTGHWHEEDLTAKREHLALFILSA